MSDKKLFCLTASVTAFVMGAMFALLNRYPYECDAGKCGVVEVECEYEAIIDYNPGRVAVCELFRRRWTKQKSTTPPT